ncbi:MAG: hypothetical protein ACNA7Y_01585 [Gammaproteobacteria bacterium]
MRVSNKYIVIYLIVFFFGPVVMAWYLYTHQEKMGSNIKTIHHGTLIQPVLAYDQPTKNKWLIIYSSADADIAYKLQQVHKTLGKDQRRVERLQRSPNALFQPGRIYLVDPLGNIFMYYPDAVLPKDLKADLVRLLKISRIG